MNLTKRLRILFFGAVALLGNCILIAMSASAADYHVFSISCSPSSSDHTSIVRYTPGLDPFPGFGLFQEVVRRDRVRRTDIETDGQSLFLLESLDDDSQRIANYSTSGSFLGEISLPSGLGEFKELIYESNRWYSMANDDLYEITTEGVAEIARNVSGVAAYRNGFVALETGTWGNWNTVRILNLQGNTVSEVVLDHSYSTIVADGESTTAYLFNARSEFAVLDFSNPAVPVVVTQGVESSFIFHADFDPMTGNIFGSTAGAVLEFNTDGEQVTQFMGSPFGFNYGVAVLATPEPTKIGLLHWMLFLILLRVRRTRTTK